VNQVKIATCCYCGTRAALVLAGGGRYELACRSCGAPLTELKCLKAAHPADRLRVVPSRVRRKEPVRRKGLLRRAWEEALDEIEDLFD
jgi:hypothetical protein